MNSVKYVGLDVHQSTISVAVLNAEGRLVMQSVIATQAAAILDFIAGQRGTLQVTFEEGTHSAWLYDLLVRRVARLVVCNPRQNALLKSGNKSGSHRRPQISGTAAGRDAVAGVPRREQHGRVAATGGQLHGADTRHHPGDGADQGPVPESGDCLCGEKALGEAPSPAMVGEADGGGTAAASGVVVRRAGRGAGAAPPGAAGTGGGEPQARGREAVAHDAVSRSAARGGAAGQGANPVSLSQQASVLGLLRAGAGDAQQRRLCDPKWRGGTPPASAVHPRIELEP